jgi:hypothetical protein
MKYRKLGIILAALVLLYASLGFFLLPAIIKPKLVTAIEEFTHRQVTLGGLGINPFSLSLTLKDFELKDRDNTRLLSFSRLYLNYEIISLFKDAYVFSEFQIDTPFVSVRVLKDGQLSVNDLLERPSADTVSGTEHPFRLVIDNFTLTQGRVRYQDDSRRTPLAREIDSLNLSLANFTTLPNEKGLYEFTATTARKEELHWQGSVSVSPARSAGAIDIKNLRAPSLWEFMGDRLKFRVESGLVDLHGEYDLDASGPTPQFKLRNGSVALSNLILTDPNDSIPPLSLPRGTVRGIAFDYPAQSLTMDSIGVEGLALRTAYLADGTMTIQDLLTPIPNPADTSRSTLRMKVNTINASQTNLVFIDRTMEPEAPMVMSDLTLAMHNLCFGLPGMANLNVSGILNGQGAAGARGTLSLEPKRADLDLQISGTPFAGLQPYLSRYSRARQKGGTLSCRGTIAYAGVGETTMLSFKGGVALDGIRIDDPVLKEDLTRWDRLELKGVDYRLSPPSLTIKEIVATRPYLRAIIGPDRTLNFQHVMFEDSAAVHDSISGPAPGGKAEAAAPRTATRIGAVNITDGTMNFSDLSLTPNFVVTIQQMAGSVKGLSSEQLARADVDISGKVDKYAPATIKGQINPLSDKAYTDISLNFQGIELTTFTPYSGKFAGYKIDRGKLNLDLHYKLNNRYLDGTNKIVFDQLTLGEKVEGPDVTSLPVKLAIALLKDSHGVIDLDVPVSGSLDDPEFSLFPVILKAFVNLLWKIVKAPFTLIAHLFGGGGEDLQYVSFKPGSDSLMIDQQAKLATVAKGLSNRPQLELDVRGGASNTADRNVIAEQVIVQQVRPGGSGPLTLADEKPLLGLYEKTFKQIADSLVPSGGSNQDSLRVRIFEAAQQRLLDSARVSESDLRMLAQRRAAAIMDYLTHAQAVDSTRLFLQEPETTANPNEGMVRTTLNLTAR